MGVRHGLADKILNRLAQRNETIGEKLHNDFPYVYPQICVDDGFCMKTISFAIVIVLKSKLDVSLTSILTYFTAE